ncbi:hypothetical protein T492DRAFT_471110 [Pavlovales sp. CCMP2436]|nr:hypothetical protein T492DRAFT_471110 [Pavlovales sp. CCMP2436]
MAAALGAADAAAPVATRRRRPMHSSDPLMEAALAPHAADPLMAAALGAEAAAPVASRRSRSMPSSDPLAEATLAADLVDAPSARSGRAAVRDAAAAPSSESAQLEVHIVSLVLDDVGALDDLVDDLAVSVDVPGSLGNETSHRVPVADRGLHLFEWSSTSDVRAGAPVRRALIEALGPEGQDEDTEVVFTVRGLPRGGALPGVEVGSATVALATVLARGRELSQEQVSVLAKRDGAKIGTLTVSTVALAALMEMDRALDQHGDARSALEADARAAPAASRRDLDLRLRDRRAAEPAADDPTAHELVFSISRVRLFDVRRDVDADVDELQLHLDLLGATDERTPAVPVQASGDHRLRYSKAFDAAPGSKLREALLDALDSPTHEDSDAYLVLYGLARSKSRSVPPQGVELGSAFVNFEQVLLEAASVAGAERTVKIERTTRAGSTTIGELTLRLNVHRALKAAGEPPPPPPSSELTSLESSFWLSTPPPPLPPPTHARRRIA